VAAQDIQYVVEVTVIALVGSASVQSNPATAIVNVQQPKDPDANVDYTIERDLYYQGEK